MPVNNMTLVKIAALGGIATCTMGMLLRYKLNDNLSKTEYYKEAMNSLKKHSGAVKILGEPIRDCLIDIGNTEKNYTYDSSAHYEIPIKGSKENGVLYFWAKKSNVEDKWSVTRIELELKSDPNKRLLIKGENL